jgi:hypothetical protein
MPLTLKLDVLLIFVTETDHNELMVELLAEFDSDVLVPLEKLEDFISALPLPYKVIAMITP